jgi:hypothetical protein
MAEAPSGFTPGASWGCWFPLCEFMFADAPASNQQNIRLITGFQRYRCWVDRWAPHRGGGKPNLSKFSCAVCNADSGPL